MEVHSHSMYVSVNLVCASEDVNEATTRQYLLCGQSTYFSGFLTCHYFILTLYPWIPLEYHSSVGSIYTRACGTRVNASRQTRDILPYSMINLYLS